MCKKLICLSILILVLRVAGNASANLVGHWKLDEGSGTTAYDSSGNGFDGTLIGDTKWVAGKYGPAVEVDGNGDYVEIPPIGINSNTVTMSAWIKRNGTQSNYTGIFFTRNMPTNNLACGLNISPGGTDLGYTWNDNSSATWSWTSNLIIPDNEWCFVALVVEPTQAAVYVDEVYAVNSIDHIAQEFREPLWLGQCTYSADRFFDGQIDDARVYDRSLTEGEILGAMQGSEGWPYALGPDPEDGALHEETWVTLSWRAGDFSVSHDVYLGDNYDDVSNATPDSDVFRGNQVATFFVAGFPGFAYPDGLAPGTTFYWRIDEVNDADPNSPWKGDIWSFSIPPKTAYNPDPADGAGIADTTVTLAWTAGFGAKLHTIYFGDDFDTVANATVGTPVGTATYNPGPLEAEKVYYWRVDEFDGTGTFKGDVWAFTTPGAVGNPQPAIGATDVGMNAILRWTPADSAVSHQLYLGTDKAAVRNADTNAPEYRGSIALGIESHDPGLLEADTTYCWRVDEVDAQGNTLRGPIWIFMTGSFLLVDDFEGYTDDDAAGEAIWQTWIDGFGVADNGAQVGNLLPPYAEQTIVHGGAQSMPLLYRNEAGVTNSEAAMTLTAPRDWTQAGVAGLSLWFRGDSVNALEPLYTSISNTAGSPMVVPYDDPSAATVRSWVQWRIPLQSFADQGVDLTNVDKIAIGLGSKGGTTTAGGSGAIYVDDIRLYLP